MNDPQPPPPKSPGPNTPVEVPPDQPNMPTAEPNPTPIGDPAPNEPVRMSGHSGA